MTSSTSKVQHDSIVQLLHIAALEHGDRGLFVYPSGEVENSRFMGYPELLHKAQHNASRLLQAYDLSRDSVILLHFKNHLDNIEWFWSVLLAGCVPAISTPFTNGVNQRRKHQLHLHDLLQDPICLTREELLSEFMDDVLTVRTIEETLSANDLLSPGCPPLIYPSTSPDLESSLDHSDLSSARPSVIMRTEDVNLFNESRTRSSSDSKSPAVAECPADLVLETYPGNLRLGNELSTLEELNTVGSPPHKFVQDLPRHSKELAGDWALQPDDASILTRPEELGQNNPSHYESEPEVCSQDTSSCHSVSHTLQGSNAIAALMLTSGSTGNAKAVCISHRQILASLAGKSYAHGTRKEDTLLSWIALDHVASLVEVHLHAIYLGGNQVQVHAPDIVQNPLSFLELLGRHRVAFSFAPNFFLAKLNQALTDLARDQSAKAQRFRSNLNLDFLRTLTSGGEANVIETCAAVTEHLKQYGAGDSVISPGYGLTETCAGCIFNKTCPQGDLAREREFAALGSCVPGVTMRLTLPSDSESTKIAEPGERGNLEVKGPIVFTGYYNNPSATADAFTPDGWFRTGDQAFIDSFGHLNLVGRTKEIMIINGVKYSPRELEVALEEALIAGVTPGFLLAFSYRPKMGSQTEQICVAYLPQYSCDDTPLRAQANDAIGRVTLLQTGVRPYVLPLSVSVLHKSTLGKLPRAKIQAAFQRGDYMSYQTINDDALDLHRKLCYETPANDVESIILEECESLFDLPKDSQELGVNDNIFDLGVTSIDLIRMKQRLQKRLGVIEIPIINILTHPTVRSLAATLNGQGKPRTYDPVIVLQSHGTKAPLWLVHPGVGEVLVFLALAKHITDRPVYALRARGFDGEPLFENISEVVSTYHAAIRAKQPSGPYAIAGYSYGSMLAFEIAKILQSKDEVRFLGSFNLPPHIKARMQQLNWTECLLHLAYFLELITDAQALEISPALHALARHETLAHVMGMASPARLLELGLDEGKLGRWADVALGLQSMAREYEPSGCVKGIDVFYAVPLLAVARSKEEWRANHLSQWSDFSCEPPRFHEVDGAHYTMISPAHVFQFQKKLKAALRERGL
ncbi:hypothetical protein MMC25_005468 [Agyrium rufum]|nr:hypothetical protein [Agyrium rufum]